MFLDEIRLKLSLAISGNLYFRFAETALDLFGAVSITTVFGILITVNFPYFSTKNPSSPSEVLVK